MLAHSEPPLNTRQLYLNEQIQHKGRLYATTSRAVHTARLKQNWTQHQEIEKAGAEAMLAEFRVREKEKRTRT